MLHAARKAPQATPVAPRPGHRAGSRPEELARRLTAMMPQAAVLTVRLQGPHKPWPHLEVRARDADGIPVHLTRTQELVSACWIIGVRADAERQVLRNFGVRTTDLGGGAL